MSQTRKNDQIGQIKIEDKVSEDVSITEQWFVDAKKSRLTRTEVGMFLSLRGLGSCDGPLTNRLYANKGDKGLVAGTKYMQENCSALECSNTIVE